MFRASLIFLFLIIYSLPSFANLYEDSEHWKYLKQTIFGNTEFKDGSDIFEVISQARAQQGSHVPVSIVLLDKEYSNHIEKIYIIADNNPVPLLATVSFTNKFQTGTMFSTVIRIEEYTPIRAIAKTKSGDYLMSAVFVKAAGGCSGELVDTENIRYGDSQFAVKDKKSNLLMGRFEVAHPNFSGLQFNQHTRHYIPADYIDNYEVLIDGKSYFNIESSIAVSTNPHFEIALPEKPFTKVELKMKDIKGNDYNNTWDI